MRSMVEGRGAMLRDDAPKAGGRTVRRARALRREMTLPEVLLWQMLRARASGLKSRRQHPSGPYVMDFYCGDARLCIEVDGAIHDAAERHVRDAARDGWLAGQGIATLRIAARDLLADRAGVADAIVAACRTRLPLHHPASPGGPPPRDELGED